MLERLSDFFFVKTSNVAGHLTKDDGVTLKDPLPAANGSEDDLPYDDPSSATCDVAAYDSYDAAYLAEAVLERSAFLSAHGTPSISEQSKADVQSALHCPLYSTIKYVAQTLRMFAQRWRDEKGNMQSSGGFIEMPESLTTEWIAYGPRVTLKLNEDGLHNFKSAPDVYDASISYQPYSDSRLFPGNDFPFASSKMLQSVMEDCKAIEDFDTVRRILGQHFDKDSSRWATDDGFVEDVLTISGKDLLVAYSDLEKCNAFIVNPSRITDVPPVKYEQQGWESNITQSGYRTVTSGGVSSTDDTVTDQSSQIIPYERTTGTYQFGYDSFGYGLREVTKFFWNEDRRAWSSVPSPYSSNLPLVFIPHFDTSQRWTRNESQVSSDKSSSDSYIYRTYTSHGEIIEPVKIPISVISGASWSRDQESPVVYAWLGFVAMTCVMNGRSYASSVSDYRDGNLKAEIECDGGVSIRFVQGTVDTESGYVVFDVPSVDSIPGTPLSGPYDVNHTFDVHNAPSSRTTSLESYSGTDETEIVNRYLLSIGPLVVKVKPKTQIGE